MVGKHGEKVDRFGTNTLVITSKKRISQFSRLLINKKEKDIIKREQTD
jgi:hypothetical protein